MLSTKDKLDLQRKASAIKKQLADVKDTRQRLGLQREWSGIIKQLKGVAADVDDSPEGRTSFVMSPKGGQIGRASCRERV